MKNNQTFTRKMIWLLAGSFASIHFLTAQVGIAENLQHIVTNVKTGIEGCISQPIPWKSMISIFMPVRIG